MARRSVQDAWDGFERWARRYQRVCNETIAEMCGRGHADPDEALFICRRHEFNQDLDLHSYLQEQELRDRVDSKIRFLRGYLRDIMHDGAEFMCQHSAFLPLQYPSRCAHAMTLWLEQDMEDDTLRTYAEFLDIDMTLFVKNLEDVDLSSIRNVLPFNRLHLKNREGVNWSNVRSGDVLCRLKYDLESDGNSFDIDISWDEDDEIMSCTFRWK